ncbi:MAG: DUF3014 domain-containing protein [Acidobacteria bacterium]|nr:DUF3014 domain-containing protein [Acidobacteriota bacterium]
MGKKKTAVLVGVVVLVVATVAVYYFFLKPSQPPEITGSTQPEESLMSEMPLQEESIEPIEVELNKSDELVRKLVEELSSHPALAQWLMTDYLIRRFVATVDLIANGESPRRPMDFIEMDGDFQVREEDGQVFLDPAGYDRYVRIAAVLMSLDAKGCAILYKRLSPPIQQAYKEMGYPDEDFNATLKKAIFNLIETPVIRDRIYLEKGVLNYHYADPELEKLNPSQKHLLRMGPDNMSVIQAKLREIARYLGYSFQDLKSAD